MFWPSLVLPLVGFDLAGLATFVLCPLVLPLVFVAHWICWAHWCCRLVFWGPLVLSLVIFVHWFRHSFSVARWFCHFLVRCPTGFAAYLFVGPPAGFATDLGNIEQRQDLIILPFTIYPKPLSVTSPPEIILWLASQLFRHFDIS